MNNFMNRMKRSVSNFFTGDEGSFFWLVETSIAWTKQLVRDINTWLASRRVESENRGDD